MKRLAVLAACGLALGFGVLFVAVSEPQALRGPDPPGVPESFSIIFEEQGTSPALRYDTVPFTRSAGWDFGDRESYRCAYVERFDAQGRLLFKVEFERSNDYPVAFRINDRGGVENEQGAPDNCGSPAGEGGWNPAGEDHFPHHTHAHFFIDGEEITAPDAGPLLDLHRPDCNRGYWTPGDEPGEAILWWDVDGPTHTHPGGPPLDCGSGPVEPSAVARALVIPVAANAGVCIHDDIDGRRCWGMTEPPSTQVVLGPGRTVLTCHDGSIPEILQPTTLLVRC